MKFSHPEAGYLKFRIYLLLIGYKNDALFRMID